MDSDAWQRDGWVRLGKLVPADAVEMVRSQASQAGVHGPDRRILETVPAASQVAALEQVVQAADSLLDGPARLVRALWFDKPAGRNWPVLWHQDKTICVAERHEVDGFGPWSVKRGVPHVEPPAEVLQRMATIRIHLDACGAANGPLRVIPGTHHTKLSPEEVDQASQSTVPQELHVGEGEALAMRPLLLHSSRRATAPASHRRVLHLEFATGALPAPLRWRD